MINFDSDQNDDFQIVDGNFSISSGSTDPNAFFNMNLSEMNQNDQSNKAPSHHFNQINGGFGPKNYYGNNKSQKEQFVTPNTQKTQAPLCDGNCGACVWSFMCKKVTPKFSSVGGCGPRLT